MNPDPVIAGPQGPSPGHRIGRTPGIGVATLWLILCWGCAAPEMNAAEKPTETNPPSPPRLVIALPPFVVPGVTNTLVLRGQRLSEITHLRQFWGTGSNEITMGSVTNAPVPERYKPERTGDQQVELRWVPPPVATGSTNLLLIASSAVGASAPFPLLTLGSGEIVTGFQPSSGFDDAPPLPTAQWISGTLRDRRDVAVFRIDGRKGERLVVQVWAWRLGSTLDAALTLHDARGAVLHRVDDSAARDPVLDYTLPVDGTYFLSMAGMDERAAPTHVYLMRADLGGP